MNAADVIRLVKLGMDMRAAQRGYFSSRSRGDLINSKELERSFDQACAEALVSLGEATADLFGGAA